MRITWPQDFSQSGDETIALKRPIPWKIGRSPPIPNQSQRKMSFIAYIAYMISRWNHGAKISGIIEANGPCSLSQITSC